MNVSDVYDGAAGSLKVTKTIAGPAAREHGRIAILVACGGLNDFVFLIRARTGPGSVSRSFDGLPAGSRCTITETPDGHTNAVAAVTRGRRNVNIRPNRRATAHLTNTFRLAPPPPPPPLVTG